MKLSLAAVLAAFGLILLACVASKNVPVDLIASMPAMVQEEATNVAPDLSVDADTFYVNFEIVVFQEQIDQYPVTYENLKKALAEWSRHIPVRWTVLTETPGSPMSLRGRPGAIEIHLADMQSPEYGLPKQLLGLWQSSRDRIVMDADFLDKNPEKAYSVSLHELGHMFGVPHVIGFLELGATGYLVLPMGEDATNYVMYPRSIVDRPQKSLSAIEIKLARHNLLHHWTRPDRDGQEHECELYTEN